MAAAEAGRPAAAAPPRAPPPSSPGGARDATALDAWQLSLLQEEARQARQQLAQEHDRLREAAALEAKPSPAVGEEVRSAWRRVQGAEAHLVWLRSLQSA